MDDTASRGHARSLTYRLLPPAPRRPPILDVAGGVLLIPLGLIPFVLGAICIAALEAYLLARAFRWPSLRLALRDALVANLLSGLVGVLIFFLWPSRPWFATLLALYVFTVILEAVILERRRGLGWARSCRASLVINLASYALLLLAVRGFGLWPW